MADPLYRYQRYALATRMQALSTTELKAEMERHVTSGHAHFWVKPHGFGTACTMLGRNATSTTVNTGWEYATVARNWVKSCLKNDAPEGSK